MTYPKEKENSGMKSSFGSFRSTRRCVQYQISRLFLSEPLRPCFEEDILKIYEMSKNSILSAARDFTECSATDNRDLYEKIYRLPFDKREEWDLKLGDYVRILDSEHDFQKLQTAVVGWQPYLKQLCGRIGIVVRVLNKYLNSVSVEIPHFFPAVPLYNGVLTKLTQARDPIGSPFLWKVDDFVQMYVKRRILRLVAQGYRPIPYHLHGKRGRVVATRGCFVFVTFDEIQAYGVDPESLAFSQNKFPLVVPRTPSHPRGFQIGEKVKVLSDPKQLVLNQKKLSSLVWELQMSRLRGERVTIVNIMDDGSVAVQMTNCPPLVLNHESVLHLYESDVSCEEPLSVYVGDFVRVKKYVAAEAIFDKNNIPDSFWEYLQRLAIVKDVDVDLNIYYINFGHGEDVPVQRSSIEKVFSFDENDYHGSSYPLEHQRQGDFVHFDVGPREFVRDVLRGTAGDKRVSMDPVLILGFYTAYHIKVRYFDGKIYTVNVKHFTPTFLD